MLLQHIVEKLDTELHRLQQLRDVVSSLAGSSILAFDQPIAPIVEAAPIPVQAPPEEAKPARKVRIAGVRRGPMARRPKTPAEPIALTAAIPAAPVVVSAAALAREGTRGQRRTVQAEPKPEPGSLGSMIRALHLQANT